MNPKALILTGYGINCDMETQHAFKLAGAEAERVHLTDLINGARKLSEFHILAFPGGFSFGDDIASGKVLANMIKYNLGGQVREFIDAGKLIIGICNGFQAMVKMGLLPAFDGDYSMQDVTLTFNDSGRFEDRWVHLKTNKNSKCVFTKGIDGMYLPVRHGEGKFV
ncbi:MAG: phosphoribosylformylglycinamidine synthase subunit PurQ, partial [Candidatus Methanoperedens sp.]|nr:phosphoribosylformylglycinamidine synthase subunit PurQ [Candidatus Methanoperedens sp.]